MSKQYTPEEQIRRAFDVLQIKNVMARHAYLHAASRHDIEYALLWSHNQKNISWGNVMGFTMIGQNAIWKGYAEPHVGKQSQKGVAFVHTLTTPLIEIAEDGQTAQAMWYTPGYGTGPEGGPNAVEGAPMQGEWMYERYAVDFIRENGAWKIWHFFVGTDFSFPAGGTYTEFPMMHGEKQVTKDGIVMPGFYTSHYNWSPFPHWPKPYKTWTPEIGYGPEKYMEEEA